MTGQTEEAIEKVKTGIAKEILELKQEIDAARRRSLIIGFTLGVTATVTLGIVLVAFLTE